jgi:hypothetical protein
MFSAPHLGQIVSGMAGIRTVIGPRSKVFIVWLWCQIACIRAVERETAVVDVELRRCHAMLL